MSESCDSMLDPKYIGGIIGGKGYAFQNAYVLYHLPDWLAAPAFVGLQPEGWEDVEVFFEDEAGKRREAIQVKDHPVIPSEAKKIFAEFQHRAEKGERAGIAFSFRLASLGVSKELQPVKTGVELYQARTGYTEAEMTGTRDDLARRIEKLGLEVPIEFLLERVTFETDLWDVSKEDVLRCVLMIRLYRAGYGRSLLDAEYTYVQLAAELDRWLREKRYIERQDIEGIIQREAGRHPEPIPEGEFVYDVFLSYSLTDQAWVRDELSPRLEAAGLKPCTDLLSATEMKQAVLTSRKTLPVLTPDYLESTWADFEALMLNTLDPAQRAGRLIPLLKADCERPILIRYLPYVDLADPEDWEQAWRQLLTALGAPPVQEAPEEPTRAEWCLKHPYPMPPNFTGRTSEREMLNRWLKADPDHPLLVLRALGGFGKSALTWHWLLHDVDPARWPRVVWWSFYERDASFEEFLQETLAYLGVEPRNLGLRQQADELLRLLQQPGILLFLDGFERALRAYSGLDAAYRGDDPQERETQSTNHASPITQHDCVSPIAEHFLRSVASLPGMIRSKVLMTTRLRPSVLEVHGDLLQGCREEELTQMQPADAVAFFRAQGVRGGRAEIEAACQRYGYHPLSLRLLAGLVARDLQQPGDIAAARRLDVSGDLVRRQHHVLAQAYDNLTPARQQLLSRMACFRGAVAYETLEALAAQPEKRSFLGRLFGRGKQVPTVAERTGLRADLRDLVARGLLHHDRQTHRYDLHPIVRRYAYDQLSGAERTAAHGQLRDYFAAVPPPERVQCLEDLTPVIELYHHTVRAGQYDEARTLFRDRLVNPLHFQFGAYQLNIELLRALFPNGEEQPPRLKDESAQAWTLTALANSYSFSGQPRRAVPLFELVNDIYENRMGNKQYLAIGLGNLADDQLKIGALRAAEANLRRGIALGREIEEEWNEAIGHQELGRLLAYRGAWGEAEEELTVALALFEKQKHVQLQGITWAYRALRALLLARWTAIAPNPQPPISNTPDALVAARRALELADETANDPRFVYPVRDYARAHWLLGAAHRANGHIAEADRHLSEALTRCRGINMVDHEADIMLDLARLQAATGARDEALRLAQEALVITERSEYVLQGADVHLFLAHMALEDGDRETALEHAREARRLATCDGPPDYIYKVAYDEAGALLERLEERQASAD